MKRLHGFRVLTLAFGQWNIITKAGQWQLLPQMVPGELASEISWRSTLSRAVAAYEDVIRRGSDEEVAIVCEKRIVLSVIGRNALESQLLDSNANPIWASTKLQNLSVIADSPVFFNKNKTDIAWVEMSGAEQDVPCMLSFLEKRARKKPDGIYGRLLARQNEIVDYFRPG